MTLQERLEKVLELRKSLVAQITNAATKEALDTIELDLRKADMEIEDLKRQLAEEKRSQEGNPEARKASSGMPQGGLNPIATYGVGAPDQRSESTEDVFGTLEYRNAFKDYIIKGTPIPAKFTEQRADQLTTVGDET